MDTNSYTDIATMSKEAVVKTRGNYSIVFCCQCINDNKRALYDGNYCI